jgi:hypothetical protein
VRWILAAVLLAACFGCADSRAPSPPRAATSAHGYALLHEILEQERQVSNLLIIKEERDDLEALIDAIAAVCDTAYDRLEELAEQPPRLELSDTGLPAEEVQTRQALAATHRAELLASSGQEFDLQLLWSQNEALMYAAHLADTLARSEPDPARLAFVQALWQDLTRLQADTRTLLRSRTRAGG